MKLAIDLFRRPRAMSGDGFMSHFVSPYFYGRKALSGERVSAASSLTVAAVYRAISLLAQTQAMLPLHVYLGEGDKTPEREHHVDFLLNKRLNDELDSYTGRRYLCACVEGWGNAYAEQVLDRDGNVMALYPLKPWRMKSCRDVSTDELFYEYTDEGGTKRPLRREQVLHIRDWSWELDRGLSKLEAGRDVIGAAMAKQKHASKFFANGAMPGGIISYPDKLPKDKPEQIRQQWQNAHGGENIYGIGVLSGGASWINTAVDPEKAQLLASMVHSANEVAVLFGLPPHMLGDLSRATFCMPADTEVLTEHGPKSIAKVSSGENVWSLDRETGDFKLSRVKHSVETGTDPILSFRTTNRTVRANARHRLLVHRKRLVPDTSGRRIGGVCKAGKLCRVEWHTEWVPAGEIRKGDCIVTPKGLPDTGSDLSPTRKVDVGFMEFCGLLLGDGNVHADSGAVTIARATNATYMDHYRREMVRCFHAGGRKYKSGENHHMAKITAEDADAIRRTSGQSPEKVGAKYGLKRHSVQNIRAGRSWNGDGATAPITPITLQEADRSTTFRSASAARELKELGWSGTARTKRIPGWVFQLADELKLALLRGFLDADGSVDKKGRVSFSSCNEAMLSQVRHLCMMLGIPVTNLRCQEGVTTLPNGKRKAFRQYSFTCSDPGANRRIGSHTPEYVERMNAGKPFGKKDRNYPEYGGRQFKIDSCQLARVVEINEEPPEAVYDLEVEGTHSFIANGVVVHNSNIAEQALDFYRHSILPRLRCWESCGGMSLFTREEQDRGYYIEHVVEEILRADISKRYAAYAVGRQWGWLSINDVRRFENMSDIGPEGDRYKPPNMAPAGSEQQGDSRPDSQEQMSAVLLSVMAMLESGAKVVGGDGDPREIMLARQVETELAKLRDERRGAVLEIRGAIEESEKRVTEAVKETGESFHAIARVANAKVLQASHRALCASMQRMLTKETKDAKRASRNPRGFLAWLDGYYGEYEDKLCEAIEANVDACLMAAGDLRHPASVSKELAGLHVTQSKNLLLEASGECGADELQETIAELVDPWRESRLISIEEFGHGQETANASGGDTSALGDGTLGD